MIRPATLRLAKSDLASLRVLNLDPRGEDTFGKAEKTLIITPLWGVF